MRLPFPLLLLRLGLVAFAGLLGACATAPRVSPVAVGLVNLEAREATAFETRLAVTVRFTNESPEPLALRGSSHKLVLNGRDLGAAVGGEPLDIPALSSVSQELTLSLSNFTLLALARDLQRDPAAFYEIESTLYPASRLGRNLRVSKTGRLDLRALAAPR